MHTLSVPRAAGRSLSMVGGLGLVLGLAAPGLGWAQAQAQTTTAATGATPGPAATTTVTTTTTTAQAGANPAVGTTAAVAGAGPASSPGAKAAPKASSGIYRSTEAGGTPRYGTIETPGALEVTRESIRTRTVTAPPLDSVTPEYRVEVADTCQVWRDRVTAWRAARAVYVRENDGRVRLLSEPERAHTIGRFVGVETYWCRPAAAEKIQAEYRLAEARRLAAEERAATAAAHIVKVERR